MATLSAESNCNAAQHGRFLDARRLHSTDADGAATLRSTKGPLSVPKPELDWTDREPLPGFAIEDAWVS